LDDLLSQFGIPAQPLNLDNTDVLDNGSLYDSGAASTDLVPAISSGTSGLLLDDGYLQSVVSDSMNNVLLAYANNNQTPSSPADGLANTASTDGSLVSSIGNVTGALTGVPGIGGAAQVISAVANGVNALSQAVNSGSTDGSADDNPAYTGASNGASDSRVAPAWSFEPSGTLSIVMGGLTTGTDDTSPSNAIDLSPIASSPAAGNTMPTIAIDDSMGPPTISAPDIEPLTSMTIQDVLQPPILLSPISAPPSLEASPSLDWSFNLGALTPMPQMIAAQQINFTATLPRSSLPQSVDPVPNDYAPLPALQDSTPSLLAHQVQQQQLGAVGLFLLGTGLLAAGREEGPEVVAPGDNPGALVPGGILADAAEVSPISSGEGLSEVVGGSVPSSGSQISNLRTISSAEANAPFISDAATAQGWQPPYADGPGVRTFTTADDLPFVRLHTEADNAPGGFLVRQDEIAQLGNDPQAIQNYLGLKDTPAYISNVNVPVGTRMQAGIIGPQPNFGLYTNSGMQYQLLEQISTSSFYNTRPLQ
ncbi:hypothetical protein, partial [Dyella jejuensis]